MSFWGLLLALCLWGIIAVFVWAPWWVSALLVAGLIFAGWLCLLEHARAPVIVRGGEQ